LIHFDKFQPSHLHRYVLVDQPFLEKPARFVDDASLQAFACRV